MTTEAQRWAQQRNFGKARIRSIATQARGMAEEKWLLPNERKKMKEIERQALKVLEYYSDVGTTRASKNHYLRGHR